MQTNLINVNAGFFDDVSSDFFVIHLDFGDLKFFRRDIPFILLLDGLLWVLFGSFLDKIKTNPFIPFYIIKKLNSLASNSRMIILMI